MRILYLITDLGTGGAEMMLLKLLSATAEKFENAVVSLGSEGTIGPRISHLGVPVFSLGLRTAVPNPLRLLALRSILKKFRPSLIVGWMYHGNVIASVARRWAPGRPPLVWNIRQSLNNIHQERRRTSAVIRLGALLSRRPQAIIYNSKISCQHHEALGYSPVKRIFIPNGFDCREFQPDDAARRGVRAELGLPVDALLVGLIARYHPVKDHAGFLKAAGSVIKRFHNVWFVMAGSGVTREQPELNRIIAAEKLQERVFLLGERSDIPRLTAALDIACSTSAWAEGFSNTIGEAMACGIPCVVTKTGDSAEILGSAGFVVPPRNPGAFADAICQLIESGASHRQQLAAEARQRVQRDYSIDAIAQRYEDLYRSLVQPSSPGRSTT